MGNADFYIKSRSFSPFSVDISAIFVACVSVIRQWKALGSCNNPTWSRPAEDGRLGWPGWTVSLHTESDMELGHWVNGSMGHLGHLSRAGHRVIILTRCETRVFSGFRKKPKMVV